MALHIKLNRILKVVRKTTFALAALLTPMAVIQNIPAASIGVVQAATDGNTEVNLGVMKTEAQNVSFEVPLYYVMCVTENQNGDTVVAYPDADKYNIVNTTKGDYSVAVTHVGVTGVTGGTWSLVDGVDKLGTSATDKKMYMTIGGVPLPAVAAADTSARNTILTRSTTNSNTFFTVAAQGTDGTYTELKPYDETKPEESTLNIPVTAQVSASYKVTGSVASSAQFKVSYTITPLTKSGQLLRAYYEGPEKLKANE